ncbi:30S ribosome-binding factor RbfA [Telluribacter sp. SYSU D00476]|uniref:30S ribosome-binding factor RbfA n=1 Tax=Telluribacter sp. SYSU D00476 TaxID=2811430 RepID=UPI001FF5D836|nr:30S ribosome-binding factor RbfA [Telluribacter sp. SYSU D00476]
MESKRQQKVGRQIQKDLGDIFQKEARHLINGSFVTVTAVRMTPDLGIARAYLSFLPEKNKRILLESIQENARFIRQKLGERVRHQLRIVPEVQFFIDDTAEYAAKMDALFAGLDIPPATEEDEENDEDEKA